MKDNKVNQTQQTIPGVKTEQKFNYSWIGIYLMVMAVIMAYLLYQLWPNFTADTDGDMMVEKSYHLFGKLYTVADESRWLLIVILAGALGSYVHATTSFVTFVGNRSLVKSWTWWYILRPFIGSSLALIFYFVIRGGFFSASSDATQVNIYGIAAISGMVGMFSKNATDKLKEVFDNLFKTEKGQGDDARADKLEDKNPVTDKMIPLNLIKTYVIPGDKTFRDIPLTELYDLLQGTITRLPVLDDKNVARFMIHQSMLYKYMADQGMAKDGKAPASLSGLTFEDFLNEPKMKELISESMAFVPAKATLAEAKEKMESVKNCQDVFVTENGKSTEPILGWLSNVEIGKHLKG
jgi:hypothetical protein